MTYSCGPFQLGQQRQDDQLEPTYSISVPIRDVVLKTCRKQETIERVGERGSRISMLIVPHDDDDDDVIPEPGFVFVYASVTDATNNPQSKITVKWAAKKCCCKFVRF